MELINMQEWLREPRVIKPLPIGKLRHLFIDNCSRHNLSEKLLNAAESNGTTLIYFPPNTTELVQPCNALVIHKTRDAWKNAWTNTSWAYFKSILGRR